MRQSMVEIERRVAFEEAVNLSDTDNFGSGLVKRDHVRIGGIKRLVLTRESETLVRQLLWCVTVQLTSGDAKCIDNTVSCMKLVTNGNVSTVTWQRWRRWRRAGSSWT